MSDYIEENISEIRKKNMVSRIIFGIVSIAMGIAFIVIRNSALDILGYIVGSLFLLAGAVTIIAFLVSKANKMMISFIFGIVSALLGIFFLIKPNFIADMAIYLFAAIVFISGMVTIYIATIDKKANIVNWKTTLIFGIVLAVLGLLMLCFIKQDKVFIAVVIGIELIIDGVLEIIAVTFK